MLSFFNIRYLFESSNSSSSSHAPLPLVNRDDPSTYEHYTLSLLGRLSSLMNVGESYRQLLSQDTIGRLRVCAILLRDSCNAQERSPALPSDMSALYSSLRQFAGNIVGGGIASLASLATPAAAAFQAHSGNESSGSNSSVGERAPAGRGSSRRNRGRGSRRAAARNAGGGPRISAAQSAAPASISVEEHPGAEMNTDEASQEASVSPRSSAALNFAEMGRAMSQSFEREASDAEEEQGQEEQES